MIYTTLDTLREYTYFDEAKGKELPKYQHDLKKLKKYVKNTKGQIPLTDVIIACGVAYTAWVLQHNLVVHTNRKDVMRMLYTFKIERLIASEDFYGDNSFKIYLNKWYYLLYEGGFDKLDEIISECHTKLTEMWTVIWYEDNEKAINIRDAYFKRQSKILKDLLERVW
jgi:hypothetical protein